MSKKKKSNKTKYLVLGIIIFLVLFVGIILCFKFFSTKKYNYSNITYDDCINKNNPSSYCEKYLFTRNAKLEQTLTNIIDQVKKEKSQEGIYFAINELEVDNLAGKFQGRAKLDCSLDFLTDKSIIEDISNKLFIALPDDLSKNSIRPSWVDIVGCSTLSSSPDGIHNYNPTTVWRISKGEFNDLI